MTVDQLKAKRKQKKSERSTLVSRRDSVKNIISGIDNKLDDDVRDANNKITSCINALSTGLRGSSRVSTICSSLETAKEKNSGYDSSVSSSRSNLSSESARCQSRINTLDYEIRSLEQQVRDQGGTIYFWE